jgi:meso-butanediol dehydrogenase / (S,S)-butanediol dehydrogenase / diacetyl reductase
MAGDFSGRAVIVTGASSGIGRAIAQRLAAEGADLCLVAAPQDAAQLEEVARGLEGEGGRVAWLASDVGEPETASRAVETTLERFGRLDSLANNAGIGYFEEIFQTPLEHLDQQLHVNVRGMYLMAMAAAEEMAARGDGTICCTASTASFIGEEHQATYNISTGAVAELIRSLAVDLAPYGIRVNGVAPGWVHTPATEEIVADPRQWSKHRTRIPLDRPAEPSEIAAVYAFLLGDESSYMTGSIVVCDGGLTAGYRFTDWEAVEQRGGPRQSRRLERG